MRKENLMPYKLNTYDIPNLSGEIKSFVRMLEDSSKDYKWHLDQMKAMEKRRADIEHKLELEHLDKNEQRKLGTELKYVLKQRRIHKDIVEATEAISEFLDTDKGKQFCTSLRDVQGKTSKIEKYHANRQYVMKASTGNKQVITHKEVK